MPAAVRIEDGTPIWASSAIVPSRDTVVSTGMSPSVAAIHVSSTDVFVYVRVDNVGTVDLGVCDCSPVPALWRTDVFAGFGDAMTSPPAETRGAWTFTPNAAVGDRLTGPGVTSDLGTANRRAWAWSADGRMFAYARSNTGTDWRLGVIALQVITRPDGSVVGPGTAISTTSGTFAAAWTQAQFAWAASKAVVVNGPVSAGHTNQWVACPEAPSGGALLHAGGPATDHTWTCVASPCGSAVALVPRRLGSATPANVVLVSTATAAEVPFRAGNAPSPVAITGPAPSIRTTGHTALGIDVDTGAGAVEHRDDPDCVSAGVGVRVVVDRVKASTLPSANLGVASVGAATLGVLRQGQSAWVQVPNANPSGWANQSERHWCLLAQAFTVDTTVIPRPWNGQAAAPPAFPVGLVNCAQRNIEILP